MLDFTIGQCIVIVIALILIFWAGLSTGCWHPLIDEEEKLAKEEEDLDECNL